MFFPGTGASFAEPVARPSARIAKLWFDRSQLGDPPDRQVQAFEALVDEFLLGAGG